MNKKKILIILPKESEKKIIDFCNYESAIMEECEKEELVNVLNKINEIYDYIIFNYDNTLNKEIRHYIPIANNNKIFINELLINNIILDELEKTTKKNKKIEVAVILKYVIKNGINKKDFNLDKIIDDIVNYNNFEAEVKEHTKKELLDTFKSYNKIMYYINKEYVIKKIIYKVVDNIFTNMEFLKIKKEINEIFNKVTKVTNF